ncbi:MAG: efflux RND transporter periplasmic adaptor subunit [Candidatus Promineifilaceae bacterium]
MRNKSKRRYWIIGGFIVIVLVVGVLFVNRRANQAQASSQTGEIVEVFEGDLSAEASASGQVLPQREARLTMGVSGKVDQVFVSTGDSVKEGDALLQVDTAALERSVASAEQNLIIQQANLDSLMAGPTAEDIAASEASVASAQAQLDDLLNGPSEEEVASAQASVDAAEANVWAASAQVNQTNTGASESEIAAAQQQVAVNQQQYQQAVDAHDRTLECFTKPNGEQVCPLLGTAEEQARANLEVAEANLATAQAQLDALLAGPNQDAVSGAQANVSASVAQQNNAQAQLDLLLLGSSNSQIAQAEASLAQAEANHAALLAGADEEQIAIAQAQVNQAEISLAEAQDNLANATLTAPFDGVITAVNVAEGELASGVIVEMVDTNSLEVVLSVDEIDVGNLAVGQKAIVTLETWPDTEIDSEVVSIAPYANTGPDSAVVTYEVHLTLGQTDLPIRVGMTANASLITANRENVLLVPNAAINADRANGTYSVNLVTTDASGSQTVSEVPVTIGLRDSQYTQITDGLQVGDEVAIGNVLPVQSFGPGSGGGPFGGN